MGHNKDIEKYLSTIVLYEITKDESVTEEMYQNAKRKYEEYAQALHADDWKRFVGLKMKNLEEQKNDETLQEKEKQEIDFEIEVYQMRLQYNINFGDTITNQYLEQYQSNYNEVQLLQQNPYQETSAFTDSQIKKHTANMELCKYAIENNIKQDISKEENIIYDNKIDARISFIRTFEHFEFVIFVIIIYLSTTIITEETNKGTIKTLLTKPHKRSTILFSKILVCIFVILISMIIIAILQYIIGGIIYGLDSYDLGYIGYDTINKHIVTMNLWEYLLLVGISKLPMYSFIAIFCIGIGIISNSPSMTMILTLLIYIISSTALKEWSKVEALSCITRFFITNNWDFSVYLFGQTSPISGVTLLSSSIIYSIYFILALSLTIYFFHRKEITNV